MKVLHRPINIELLKHQRQELNISKGYVIQPWGILFFKGGIHTNFYFYANAYIVLARHKRAKS